jgi:hypothetical protein
VYARDVSPGRDVQTVGWRVVIKRVYQGQEKVYYRTRIAKAIAYDDTPATFSARVMQPTEYANVGDYYFVIVKLYWYNASGKLIGQDKRRIDDYVEEIANSDEQTYRTYVADNCHGYWVEPSL